MPQPVKADVATESQADSGDGLPRGQHLLQDFYIVERYNTREKFPPTQLYCAALGARAGKWLTFRLLGWIDRTFMASAAKE